MVTDEQARAAAREILAGEEFAQGGRELEAWLALVERLIELTPDWVFAGVEWIAQTLGAIFEAIGRALAVFGIAGGPSQIVGWAAACLLVAASIALLWSWSSARRARQQRLGPGHARGYGHAEAVREARALAAQGRFLEGAHRLQLGTLALLVEFEWLELARSDANPTLRRRIAHSALPERERRQLVELVDRLESLWFDEPREDRPLYEAWLSLDQRLVSLVAGGAA